MIAMRAAGCGGERFSEEEVEYIVRDPERIEPTEQGRFNAFGWAGDRYLRVTFRDLDAELPVISAVDRTD